MRRSVRGRESREGRHQQVAGVAERCGLAWVHVAVPTWRVCGQGRGSALCRDSFIQLAQEHRRREGVELLLAAAGGGGGASASTSASVVAAVSGASATATVATTATVTTGCYFPEKGSGLGNSSGCLPRLVLVLLLGLQRVTQL